MENIAPSKMAHKHLVNEQLIEPNEPPSPPDSSSLEAYRSTLFDLERNSKPQINVLTELADDHRHNAKQVVEMIEQRLLSVPSAQKLTLLYLIDSICKNCKHNYRVLFQNNIVRIFCHVYERLSTTDRQTKGLMLKLRCTWDGIFDESTMSLLDQKMRVVDHLWKAPIVPTNGPQPGGVVPPSTALSQHNMHVVPQPEHLASQQHRPDMSHYSSDPLYAKRKALEQAQIPPVAAKKPRPEAPVTDPRKVPASAPFPTGRKKAAAQNIPQHPPPPNDLIPLGAAHLTSVVDRKQPDPMLVQRNNAIIQGIKSARQPRPPAPPEVMRPTMGGLPPITMASTTNPDPKIFTQASIPVGAQPPAQYYRQDIHAPPPPSHQAVHYPQQAPPAYPPSQHHMGHVRGQSFAPESGIPRSSGPDSIIILINEQERRLFFLDNKVALIVDRDVGESFEQLSQLEPSILRPRQIEFDGDYASVFIDCHSPNKKVIRLGFHDANPSVVYIPGIAKPQEFQLGLPSRELIINGNAYSIQFGGPAVEIRLEDDKIHTFRLSDARPSIRTSGDIRYDLWQALIDKYSPYKCPPIPQQAIPIAPQQHPPMPLPPQPHPTMAMPMAQHPPISVPQHPPPPQQVSLPPIYPSQSIPPMPMMNQGPPVVPGPITTNKSLDINTLLSKIQTSGLLPVNSTSGPTKGETGPKGKKKNVGNLKNKKAQEKRSAGQGSVTKLVSGPTPVARQYITIDPAELKKEHSFVIEQSYLGGQCTNCSLRFSQKDRQSESEGKKSKYARHLDWHFRLNSRVKANPLVGAARRQFFLTEDQWMQFKEIFDNEEEEANAEASNGVLANSPRLEFPLFEANITDYQQFIEAINYKPSEEDNKTEDEIKAICTLSSEVGVEQRCTICNEKMESKWNVDLEEWRLLDCVKYRSPADVKDEIYHTNCLKELLLEDNGDIPGSIVSDLDKPPVLDAIPGLDDTKFDDSFSAELSFELNDAELKSLSSGSTSPSRQDSEMKDPSDNLEEKEEEEEESPKESAVEQVKLEELFEIEIPVAEEIKEEPTDEVEQRISSEATQASPNPKSPESVEESKDVEMPLAPETAVTPPKTKKKTGGIVIRMKKLSKPNGISESSNDVPETEKVTKEPEHASDDNPIKSMVDDECSRSSFTGTLKESVVQSPPAQDSAQPQTDPVEVVPIKNEIEDEQIAVNKPEPEISMDAEVNEKNDINLVKADSPKETQASEVNYVRKGEEISGLCTIM